MKLEWEETPNQKRMTWYEAKEYARSLGEGWRLPTVGELEQAYRSQTSGFVRNHHWSSSTNVVNTGYAWGVDFCINYTNIYYKSNYNHVRCVREIDEN